MLPRISKQGRACGAFFCLAIYMIIAIASNAYQQHVKSHRLPELDTNEIPIKAYDPPASYSYENTQLECRIKHDLKTLLQQPCTSGNSPALPIAIPFSHSSMMYS